MNEETQNLDDILLNIKSDIQSFMESVLQHQEDIISDIGKAIKKIFNIKFECV